MQKTIFKRYLKITMMIVTFSFVLLGAVVISFFSYFLRQEKRTLLVQNASSIAEMTKETIEVTEEGKILYQEKLISRLIENDARNIEADIFVTDLEGNIMVSSFYDSKDSKTKLGEAVPSSILQQIGAEPFQEIGKLDGFYNKKNYTVAIPLEIERNGEHIRIGAVFVSTGSSPISASILEIIRTFLLAAILVLAITFCVVGFFSYSLVKPLRQMSSAVKRFGEGDFSVRMVVETQDEMGQLAHAFNDMANAISSSEVMRRSFVANVSHELKTPMTTIAGFIDGVLDGTIKESEREKYLQIVSEEIKRLSRLVKSMLDLSRIDSGEMQIQPTQFDLFHTIFSTLMTFEKAIEDKKIEIRGLEGSHHQIINGDQDLLHQVMYNLVENAVKFTQEGGYIAIRVTDSIDRISVSIENSGSGIDPDDLPMIFERFYKTDKSRSHDRNGMGLGLYIVRTIIKLHGGEIMVSSKPQEYARFEFYLPKRRAEEPSKAREQIKAWEALGDDDKLVVFDAEIIDEDEQMDGKTKDEEKPPLE